MTLFDKLEEDKNNPLYSPLADRMRPADLGSFVGQEHLVGKDKILYRMIKEDKLFSMIFWGPPGCGKTTLARIIANKTKSKFISFSAVTSGIKQIKEVLETAQYEKKVHKKNTILFIDEIHRFNKAQQDAFLPFVENGTIILIGATTENPSFEVISALLSRCKVFILNKLTSGEIKILLKRALTDKEKGYGKYNIDINDETLDFISRFCDGDSRIAYNTLEMAVNSFHIDNFKTPVKIDIILIENIIQKTALIYDKNGEEHFNLISALHKSLRGSDPDASVYWTMRMIEGGEDPLYILRRMVRFASEDVGLADPNALTVTVSAKESFEFIGPPEGYLAILEAVIYLALAPKSNSLYLTYQNVEEDIKKYQSLPVPYHIRNAPTRLMKEIGYSKGYKYPHNFDNAVVNQSYLPEELKNKKYYTPIGRGFEKELIDRIQKIYQIKNRLENKQ
ncbi:MAG: replication-associated recombination protein A [Actinobacteria bacterium]|nr:replication-associated recombination protein A [Actinomycetota bacterium]